MPSIYELKPAFQGMLRPVTRALANSGVTANHITLVSLMLSFASGAILFWRYEARWPLLIIPFVLFLRMGLNAIDGMLAREFNMKTSLGAILNELGDVLSDAAIYLPFAIIPGVPTLLLVPVVLLAIISEMTGVLAIQIGAQRRYDGPMGKSDRAFVFGSIALALGLGIAPGLWLDIVLSFTLVLSVWTIFNRACCALKESSE